MSAVVSRWMVAAVVVANASIAAAFRPQAPLAHAVTMKQVSYAPASIVAAVGDTIVWLNEDLLTHTVTGDTARWDSGDIPARKSWRLVVRARGTISYHCELHPAMKGSVVVK